MAGAPKKLCKVEGVPALLRSLEEVKRDYQKAIGAGLKEAGLFILLKSQELVPIEYGNLRGSGFVRSSGSGIKTEVRVGYTAEYAVWVHELVESLHGAAYNAAYIVVKKGTGKSGKIRGAKGRFLKKKDTVSWSRLAKEKGYHMETKTDDDGNTFRKEKQAKLRRPQEQAKFLETAVRRNIAQIRQIVIDRVEEAG